MKYCIRQVLLSCFLVNILPAYGRSLTVVHEPIAAALATTALVQDTSDAATPPPVNPLHSQHETQPATTAQISEGSTNTSGGTVPVATTTVGNAGAAASNQTLSPTTATEKVPTTTTPIPSTLPSKKYPSIEIYGYGSWEELKAATDTQELECVGWKQTMDCDGDSPRRHEEEDRSCDDAGRATLTGAGSGYCLYRNKTTGFEFPLLKLGCFHKVFKCNDVKLLADFVLKAKELSKAGDSVDVDKSKDEKPNRAIIYTGTTDMLLNMFVSIQMLRRVGCRLPVEVWHLTDEVDPSNPLAMALTRNLGVTFHELETSKCPGAGFLIKPCVLYHIPHDQVLLLDADNLPTRDPTYLFELEEFRKHGAIFWKDFWNRDHTIFTPQNEKNVMWGLLDLNPDLEENLEQESGQLLLDRRRSKRALSVLLHYAQSPIRGFFPLWGDKDFYHLAWRQSKTDFYWNPHLPGIAGTTLKRKDGKQAFCGMTMVQVDPQGKILFMHRNHAKWNNWNSFYQIWDYIQWPVAQTMTVDITGDGFINSNGEVVEAKHSHLCWAMRDNYRVEEARNTSVLATLEFDALAMARDGWLRLIRGLDLTCKGWIATNECQPEEPHNDQLLRPCSETRRDHVSGYCIFTSGNGKGQKDYHFLTTNCEFTEPVTCTVEAVLEQYKYAAIGRRVKKLLPFPHSSVEATVA